MTTIYILGSFRFDAEAAILFRGAEPVALGRRAMALLRVLVERQRIPVSKDVLIEAAWPGLTVEESNLTVQISALRRVFGEEPGGEGWIETLPRRGYRFVGPVSLKDEDAIVATSQVSDFPTTGGAPSLPLPNRPSIAVLPFVNMSSDPEQQYFSDGITEDIITELSRFRQLHILAREPGAQYVVEGSVRRVGERIRITAQLVDTGAGHHLWAERFDRSQDDIFAIQDQLVGTIVATLVGRLESASVKHAKRQPPASLAAYECVLRAIALPLGDPKVDAEARILYERAIELDPGYARAHALLATVLLEEWFRDMSESDSARDQAFECAKKAVALDEHDSITQNVLALVHLYRQSHELAELHYRKALGLNRNRPTLVATGGLFHYYSGETEEAIRCFAEAKVLDPNFEPAWYWPEVGVAHFIARRYEEAIAALSRSPNMPFWVHVYLAACYALTDRLDTAATCAAQALRMLPEFSLTRYVAKEPYKHATDREHLLEGLRRVFGVGPVSVKDEDTVVATSQVPDFPTTAGLPSPPLPNRPSIVVLPFKNMSGDPEQEYFADGVVEEIITALSRFQQLFVIARNSSFTYKDRSVDVKQVGRELGVRYALQGSVRRVNSRIRIIGQLIDAATSTHLWADRFEGGIEDIFDLQDQVTARVVAAIAPKLEQAEIERAKRKPTESLDAYDQFLRGLAGFHQWSKEGNERGLQHFYRAIELDSNYAAAYGMAARMYVQRNAGGWIRDRAYVVAETERLAMRAAELGHDDAVALATAGWALSDLLGRFEDGDAMIDRAISLNPNLAWIWLSSSWVKSTLGEPEIALQRIEQALRLSPNDPQTASFHAAKGFAQVFAGRFADAYSSAEEAIRHRPGFLYYLCIAAVSAALEGRMEDARRMVMRILQTNPALRISDVVALTPMRRPEDTAMWVDGLKKAGLPE